jgi:gamma-glutamyltranspeptidase/glutathione hydrolase
MNNKILKRTLTGSFLVLLFGFLLFPLLDSSSEIIDSVTILSEPAQASNGMVSSAHPLATRVGVEILQSGGNAFDAAVAVAAALNVVEPMMSGIGGYGTILVYSVDEDRLRFLDSSGKIPSAVDSDLFRPPTPDYRANRRGAKAVSTPGNLNAWDAMSKNYGKLKWKKILTPAIELADKGFMLDSRTARMIQSAFGNFSEEAKDIYGKNGTPLNTGARLIQKNLSRSLKLVAEQGPQVFYGGEIGRAIDKEMKSTGGFLSIEDLKADKAEWWDPISVEYRGHKVYTASPPSTAFPSLIRLGLMSQYDVRDLGHNSAEYLHRFAEVTKHAFWCRLAYAGDPEVAPPPLDKLFSKAYWQKQVSRIDPQKAAPFVPPGKQSSVNQNTTHFVTADRWGNVVSATQTLGNSFGSRIMPKGPGIWLNNSLYYCTFEPKGNPMDAHAGRRKLSGDCPTIILKEGKPWIAIGTPGGHTIGQTVPQMVMNIIDFDMDIQKAISVPRISFIEPDVIAVEERISKAVRDRLLSCGHNVKSTRGLGNAHGLSIEYGQDGRPLRFFGGADPRGAGKALGY